MPTVGATSRPKAVAWLSVASATHSPKWWLIIRWRVQVKGETQPSPAWIPDQRFLASRFIAFYPVAGATQRVVVA